MSYRHHKIKMPHKSLSFTRHTTPKFDKMREHVKRDMYNAKYSQLNQELQKLIKSTEVRPPAFSDISTILLRSKKFANRNEYNKALQQLTLAITAMLALCSPAESQFNSAKGGLGPDLGVCSNPEVLLKWHMIPSVIKSNPLTRKGKRVLETRTRTKTKTSKAEGKKNSQKKLQKKSKRKLTQKRRK